MGRWAFFTQELFLMPQLKWPEDIYEMYIYDFFLFCTAEQITDILLFPESSTDTFQKQMHFR